LSLIKFVIFASYTKTGIIVMKYVMEVLILYNRIDLNNQNEGSTTQDMR
jgi:hypothetical protein